jgi:triacylglycerol lipase
MSQVSTRHLVDPQLLALLDSMPAMELSEAMLPIMRSAPVRFEARPEDVERSERTTRKIPGLNGAPPVEVTIYRPKGVDTALPCILHIHGGGYVMGAVRSQEAAHRPLAADLGCCIISVDYRLAPETRFPGAIEDCYAALGWMVANAAELKIDPARIGVMGESAGGGLGAALALMVRDRGEYALAFQHLIYPMIDDRTCVTDDPHPYVGEFVWTPQRNHFGWSSLLGVEPGSDGVSPYAAAARAEDLSGLPPTYIATGALDLFLEEDLEYARRLIRAGVPVELHVYPGGFHGFQWERKADITRTAERDSRAALAKALG